MTRAYTISADALEVLQRSAVEGNILRLPAGHLERPLYEAVHKALTFLGGKWDRRAGGHVFPSDPAAKIAEAIGTGAVVNRQQALQHFDTPDDLAERMVARLSVTVEDICLEPSAGRGRIVAALAKHKPHTILAVEIDPDNCAALRQQGLCHVAEQDFLQLNPPTQIVAIATVVAMNPPFRGNQDIRHVLHAYHLLVPGGRLAAIVSEHGFIGQERECVEWRFWLAMVKAEIERLPDQSFKESGTNVPARMILIRKARP